MSVDFNEIRQLLVTIAQTDIGELSLKSDNFELTVRKAVPVTSQTLPVMEQAVGGVVSAGMPPVSSTAAPGTTGEAVSSRVIDTRMTTSVQVPMAAPPPIDQRLLDVLSPMVGTFYRSPAPGEPPFVEVGDRVLIGQTVCIIEAMKLMNEIEAEASGQVMEILVQNGEPIEYGQPLMRINPN